MKQPDDYITLCNLLQSVIIKALRLNSEIKNQYDFGEKETEELDNDSFKVSRFIFHCSTVKEFLDETTDNTSLLNLSNDYIHNVR